MTRDAVGLRRNTNRRAPLSRKTTRLQKICQRNKNVYNHCIFLHHHQSKTYNRYAVNPCQSRLQIERIAEDDIPLDEFASFHELCFKIPITDCFGSNRDLSHKFFQTSQCSNCRSFEGTSHLLHLNKLGTLAPCKYCFHPTLTNRMRIVSKPQLGFQEDNLRPKLREYGRISSSSMTRHAVGLRSCTNRRAPLPSRQRGSRRPVNATRVFIIIAR